jgi:hypothetical protein
MPATLEDVRNLVSEGFPGSDVSEILEENHRVFGTVRWNGFSDYSQEDRNRLVTQRVRNKLGFKALNVGMLFPRVPGEDI